MGLTLATLPGVKVQPFYLDPMDVPGLLDPSEEWKRAVRLPDGAIPRVDAETVVGAGGEAGFGEPIFLAYATTQSIDALGGFMDGMDFAFPRSQKMGAIASTVSRLGEASIVELLPLPCFAL